MSPRVPGSPDRGPADAGARAAGDATDRIVASSLASVFGAGAVIYATTATLHLVFGGDDSWTRGVLADGAVALALALVWAYHRNQVVPPRLAQPALAGALTVAAANVAYSAWGGIGSLTPLYFAFVAVGAGLLLLSWPWFAASSAVVLAAWAATVLRTPEGISALSATVVPVSSVGLGALAHLARIRAYRAIESARAREAHANADLEAALAATRESEARFRALFESAPIGIAVVDAQGEILFTNPALQRMLGYSDDELRGDVIGRVTHPEDAAREGPLFAELLAGEREQYEMEKRYVRKDGSLAWGRLVATSVGDGASGRRIFLGMVEDVTERKRSEEALRRGERLTALGTLVAGVAHEINNPLQFMMGSVELTKDALADVALAPEVPEEARRHLAEAARHQDQVLTGIERLARIAQSLRKVTRPSDGTRAPHDLGAVVDDVLTVASTRLPPSVRVDRELAARRPALANGNEISQVLLNLLLNASDAMADLPAGVLTVRTRDVDDAVVVEVEDSGVGIRPEDAARVFTPFHTTKPSGTGLGLSICHRIVEDHGGRISFESAPDRGTVFRVELPAAGASARPAVADPAPSPIGPLERPHRAP